jgi:hypothetical protein
MHDATFPLPYRTHSDKFSVAACGIDTMRTGFRNCPPELRDALRGDTVIDAHTGEVLPVVGHRTCRRVRVGGTTLTIGLTPKGMLWAAAEGRMAALLAGAEADRLASPADLVRAPQAAREAAYRVGVDLKDATPVLSRADLTVDVVFDDRMYVALCLRGLDAMPLSRTTGVRHTQKGSTVPGTVDWRLREGIIARAYDKECSRQHSSEAMQPTLRLERQWRLRQPQVIDDLTQQQLPVEFIRPFRGWLSAGALVPAGPLAVYEALLPDVGRGRKLERLIGTHTLLETVGDAAFLDRRTAGRRRSELRKLGVTSTSTAGVSFDVGEVLRVAAAAWECAVAPTGEGKAAS